MEDFDLFGLKQVPPLIERIKDSSYDGSVLKKLRNLCAKGRETQDLIRNSIPDDFFLANLKESENLVLVLQLCNNLCVQNEDSQNRLFPLITPKFKTIQWTVPPATAALMFIITCTQPESAFRNQISIDLLEPFFNLPDNDELEFCLITLFPPIASDVLRYAMSHENLVFIMLDRLHDALEHQPELFDTKTFIADLLSYIKQDVLPIKQSKSKIVGIFAAFVGCSEPARREALNQGAFDIIMKTKKIDVNDPILLEWSAAAIRFLEGDIDTDILEEGKKYMESNEQK
ncbi:hypothetical protein GPJ56_003881 [Histomonas meleagridis]|uniref:uncharacterized protein n=1 Tax=Histomonas meleagridis TaxID=135588 RepID=UPI0035595728|nr:hypothetical protein GPJ56_003881 [Histomonas meleagridis]KAH0797576.1 hypothetical protein GO595_009679 [Histomonas meleagridis]